MADQKFSYAVILAGMRTGSNLLEESLASFQGAAPQGELFNPHFFGKPGEVRRFGFDMAARDADPLRIVRAMQDQTDGLPIFRLFDDHDPRVLAAVLADTNAAKIILTRPDIESWVSLKIARKTGQWWLGDGRKAKTAKVAFDARDFAEFAQVRADHLRHLKRSLQSSGQTAFELSYDDLFEDEVILGLARWLGLNDAWDRSKVVARVQNPTPLSARLHDPEAASEALQRLFAPDLSALRNYEPPRGPGLRGFIASRELPILYMPLRSAAHDPVPDWMAGLEGGKGIMDEMNQKDLRRWWRNHPGHRSFTIVRHPLRRAWDAFARHIMPEDGFSDIRAFLVERYGMAQPDHDWDIETARAGFTVFLQFLEANLRGQTSVRVDASWTSQGRHLSAISAFATPDLVLREESLDVGLSRLCGDLGIAAGNLPTFERAGPLSLNTVTTDQIEDICARAYRRDYLTLGYEPGLTQAA